MNAEQLRLKEARDSIKPWKKWGPYRTVETQAQGNKGRKKRMEIEALEVPRTSLLASEQ